MYSSSIGSWPLPALEVSIVIWRSSIRGSHRSIAMRI
jgi:hypothetical protein